MSSRAFPSKLLDLPPDGEMIPQSTRIDGVSKPVLLPGVDIFNRKAYLGIWAIAESEQMLVVNPFFGSHQ